jgi:hypothetical protein
VVEEAVGGEEGVSGGWTAVRETYFASTHPLRAFT